MKKNIILLIYALLLAATFFFLMNQKESAPKAFYGLYATIVVCHDFARVATLPDSTVNAHAHLWFFRLFKHSFGYYIVKAMRDEIRENVLKESVSFDLDQEYKEIERWTFKWEKVVTKYTEKIYAKLNQRRTA